MEAPRPSILGGYRPGLRSVVGASATAYGYTLTVGPTSMLLTHAYGPPKPGEVLFFCSGAILAFALVGALAFGGASGAFRRPPRRIHLWGSFHFISVGLAVAAAYLVGTLAPDALGWRCGSVRGDGHVPDGRGVRERCGRSGAKEELGFGAPRTHSARVRPLSSELACAQNQLA